LKQTTQADTLICPPETLHGFLKYLRKFATNLNCFADTAQHFETIGFRLQSRECTTIQGS